MSLTISKEYLEYKWSRHGSDWYKEPEDINRWAPCPECGFTPRIWVFNNGEFANCVCGDDEYHHKHKVSAKPVMYYIEKYNWDCSKYDHDKLRKNWNRYANKLKSLIDKEEE